MKHGHKHKIYNYKSSERKHQRKSLQPCGKQLFKDIIPKEINIKKKIINYI